MEHKASRLDVKSLPNWAQEEEERSLQRQSKKHCSGPFQQGSLPSQAGMSKLKQVRRGILWIGGAWVLIGAQYLLSAAPTGCIPS